MSSAATDDGVDRRGMNPDEMSLQSPLRVGIVGPGRVGTALARALRDAGVDVDGPGFIDVLADRLKSLS